MAKSKKIKEFEQDRKKFDICFCESFDFSFQKLVYGGQT